LKKRGDKISLEKPIGSSGHGRIICNLNWTSGDQKGKGLFSGIFNKRKTIHNNNIDLDLGCLYELSDGSKSVVQALGNCFGSFENSPYILLAGDDRSGETTDGEFLYINGNHLNDIRRICIFAYIYEGAFNWVQTKAVVTVTVPDQPIIEVRLDADQNNLSMCGIALLENNNGKLKLTKLSKYFQGHKELDKHYKWGMRWTTGSK
jgi:tellurite resistance protein TerA